MLGTETAFLAALVDPMCGSGTFLIEAALMAQGRPPGSARASWPFLKWPDSSRLAWKDIARAAVEADQPGGSCGVRLLGNDTHEGALSLAKRLESATRCQPCTHAKKACDVILPSQTPMPACFTQALQFLRRKLLVNCALIYMLESC